MKTIVVHGTEELEDTKRTFDNVVQIARNEGKVYRARLHKPIVTREVLFASPHAEEDEEEALMVYGK